MVHKSKTKQVVISGLIIILSIFSLMGCSKPKSAGEQAYTFMEQAANLEKGFNDQQAPLVNEEQKEQTLYNDIMALDMKQFDQIQTKSEAALKSITTRRALIKKEKESIDSAEAVFKKAEPLLNKVTSKKSAPLAKALIKDMSNRYTSFQNLYKDYNQSLDDETALFNLLKTKDLTVEKLQAQLDTVNASYKKINADKDQFNQITQTFNKDKQAFYKSMNIMGNSAG